MYGCLCALCCAARAVRRLPCSVALFLSRVLKNTGNIVDPRGFATQAIAALRANPLPLKR